MSIKFGISCVVSGHEQLGAVLASLKMAGATSVGYDILPGGGEKELPAKKRKVKRRKKNKTHKALLPAPGRGSGKNGVTLFGTIGKFIHRLGKDEEFRMRELMDKIAAAGFLTKGVDMQRWIEQGLVVRVSTGVYRKAGA